MWVNSLVWSTRALRNQRHNPAHAPAANYAQPLLLPQLHLCVYWNLTAVEQALHLRHQLNANQYSTPRAAQLQEHARSMQLLDHSDDLQRPSP
jgi:hypothetical protein